jgi:branched-subunit amino acid ABC-type transport system permease component
MAFKLKTGKTINKVLAGAGIAALGTVILGAISPNMAQGTIGKIIPAAAAFGVGGIESAIGAVATSVVQGSDRAFTGSNSMGNLQEDSL